MKPEEILQSADYQKVRGVHEFEEWWLRKHHEFGETKEGRAYAREGLGLAKKFYSEAEPVLSFLKARHSASGVRIKMLAGNESEDALLLDGKGAVIGKIQVAYAVDGFSEKLRMRQLTRDGHVDGSLKPVVSGKGRARKVSFPETAMSTKEQRIAETCSLIEEIVNKKAAKGYGPGFILIVTFDDHLLDATDAPPFRRLHDRLTHPFDELHLVSMTGKIVISKPIEAV